MDSSNTAEIEISFDAADSGNTTDGKSAYIFYFNVKNLRPKRANLFLDIATYTTQKGEELDHDAWLIGLGNGVQGFTLSSGTFKKIGCIFYKSKLPRLSGGDKIRLTAWIEGGEIEHEFIFVCTDAPHNKFQFLSSSLEPRVADEPEPTTQSKTAGGNSELTHLVERFEILEEDFGVSFEGIYFTWNTDYDNRYQVNFNFDVIATNRDRINEIMAKSHFQDFRVQVNFYNQNGQLIASEMNEIKQAGFPGFCSVSSQGTMDQIPHRIRLFPIGSAYSK